MTYKSLLYKLHPYQWSRVKFHNSIGKVLNVDDVWIEGFEYLVFVHISILVMNGIEIDTENFIIAT